MDNHRGWRGEETRTGRVGKKKSRDVFSLEKEEEEERGFRFCSKLTSNEGKSAEASESASVYVENVKSFAEFENTVEPIAEATLTLFQCQHHAVAERQLGVLRFRTVRQSKNEQFQTGRLEK